VVLTKLLILFVDGCRTKEGGFFRVTSCNEGAELPSVTEGIRCDPSITFEAPLIDKWLSRMSSSAMTSAVSSPVSDLVEITLSLKLSMDPKLPNEAGFSQELTPVVWL